MEQYTQSGIIRPSYSNAIENQGDEKQGSRSMINKEPDSQDPQEEPKPTGTKKKQPGEEPLSLIDRLMFWCREHWYLIAAVLLVLLIAKKK